MKNLELQNDGDKRYNVYEYKNLTPKQLREIYRTVTGLNNDDEFTNREIAEYLLDTLQESEEDEEDIEYDVALGCNENDYVLASNGNIEIKKSLVDESFRKIGKELLIWFVDEDDPLHTYRVVEVTDDKVIAEFID